MKEEYKTDWEIKVWKNQYGQGIILRGKLAEQVEDLCQHEGITPKEFVERAIKNYVEELGL